MVKLYFKGECTKFINLNEETGEIEDEQGESVRVRINASATKEYEDLPVQEPPKNNLEQSPIIKSVDDEIF